MEQYAKARNKTKSWKRKQTSLNALRPVLGGLELDAITPAHLHRYVKKRKKDGRSDATINREITCVKHILNYGCFEGVRIQHGSMQPRPNPGTRKAWP